MSGNPALCTYVSVVLTSGDDAITSDNNCAILLLLLLLIVLVLQSCVGNMLQSRCVVDLSVQAAALLPSGSDSPASSTATTSVEEKLVMLTYGW